MRACTLRLLVTLILGAAMAGSVTRTVTANQSPAASDEDRLLLGTWKLNLTKSNYKGGAAPREQTRTYEAQDQGVKATIHTIYASGRSATVQFVADYNSIEHPVTGSPDADAIALKRVGPRTAEVMLSHAGKVMATARRVISEDGRTLTIAYRGELQGAQVDFVAVYDKQPN